MSLTEKWGEASKKKKAIESLIVMPNLTESLNSQYSGRSAQIYQNKLNSMQIKHSLKNPIKNTMAFNKWADSHFKDEHVSPYKEN